MFYFVIIKISPSSTTIEGFFLDNNREVAKSKAEEKAKFLRKTTDATISYEVKEAIGP